MRVLLILPLFATFGFRDCFETYVPIGSDKEDGGTGGDPVSPDPAGERCGPVTCGAGEVCCNESCGICTPPDGACIALACDPDEPRDAGPAPSPEECGTSTCGEGQVCCCDICTEGDACIEIVCPPTTPPGSCAPADVREIGSCEPFRGVYWDGTSCQILSGCSCEGEDCDATYPDFETCEAAHSGCRSCEAMDARAVGPCAASFGVAWNGTSCEVLNGCSCEGAACSLLFTIMEDCVEAHAACDDPPTGGDCGGFLGLTCAASEYCDYGDLAGTRSACGGADHLGTCMPRPETCIALWDPVCACDGNTYGNECEAAAAGQDVATFSECGS